MIALFLLPPTIAVVSILFVLRTIRRENYVSPIARHTLETFENPFQFFKSPVKYFCYKRRYGRLERMTRLLDRVSDLSEDRFDIELRLGAARRRCIALIDGHKNWYD